MGQSEEGARGRDHERILDKISGTAPFEIRMDVYSEFGETHDYLHTNTALAAGPPNVSRLTQEKNTGGTADPLYLNRSHWTASNAGSRARRTSAAKKKFLASRTGNPMIGQSEIDNELPFLRIPNAKISPPLQWNGSISSFFLYHSAFPRPSLPSGPLTPRFRCPDHRPPEKAISYQTEDFVPYPP